MGRLIDADSLDITTITTDDYSGNEILDVVMKEDIDDAPTVEAISKADYENRLKADMVAMLEEIDLEMSEQSFGIQTEPWEVVEYLRKKIIQQKINSLEEA